jgi:L-gulonate 5-dehydrogenase
MKALVYTGPETLTFLDVDDPVPSADEIVIKVDSCGICGSDMHAYRGHDERRLAPLILGHEVGGTIVDGPNSGMGVTINPLVTCGSCRACQSGRDNLCQDRQIISMPPREGGFAELVSIPIANIVEVPDNFSLERASLTEPIACGWHAVRLAQAALDTELANIRALVIGGGAIGVGSALSLSCVGASDITVLEPNETRRNFLANTSELRVAAPDDPGIGANFDLVIDAVGLVQTRETASRLVRPGGVVMHIGLGASDGGLDIRRLTLQEITFIGTYTYTAADFRATAQAIFRGRLGSLDWYETRPLSEGGGAFADIRQGIVPAAKIILKP